MEIIQVLVKLVPAFVLNDIKCYAFYDNHPRDDKNIDVIICTKDGEVQEYFKRDLVSSIKLAGSSKPSEIRILRSSECNLFYLVVSRDEITILSRKDKLEVHQIVTNVDRYDINDISCSGQASLRVFRKADAVPLVFDENFENITRPDIATTSTEGQNDDTLPIITHLKRKLTEAKYSVQCNEKTYKDFLNIHQTVVFSTYKKIHPNLDDSVFKDGAKEMARALRINTQTPWIKVCNKKIVIALNVCNMNHEALEDVHILLHGTTKQSIEYTTKIFEKPDSAPFWEESRTQMLRYNVNSAIVVVIDLEEIQSNIASKIEFSGVIFYRQLQKECLLPIEDIKLSSLDTMGVNFDVLSTPLDSNIMLAILASTEKTDLVLRHIKRNHDEALRLDIFCKYLLMETVPHCNNIAIYRQSPYHVLNGVMIVLHSETTNENYCMMMSVYSRTQSQVLAFIHYIHDAVPLSIIITPPNYKITAKDDSLSKHNEEILDETQLIHNYQNYATSILNRTGLVLKYLDDCLIKMGESKDPVVLNKIGSEIDLFAGGDAKYSWFKDKMRLEAASGLKQINGDVLTVPKTEPEAMCID